MLLPALALAAASAFAASGPASCWSKARASDAPATLDDLSACQRQALDASAASFAQAHRGRLPSQAVLDKWGRAQAAETQAFFSAHPDQRPAKATGVSIARMEDDPSAAPESDDPDSPSAQAQRQWADEQQLKKDLIGESDGGKKGVTPQMASQVADYLQRKQGGVSPDMQDLMGSLQKDGPNLSDASMAKLKKAARAADSQGLDLGVDPGTKNELLDPAPADGSAAPPSN